jgi:hypothetical protein
MCLLVSRADVYRMVGRRTIGPILLVPLACILWPDVMADYGRFSRKEPLPPGLVFGLGWFMLLLPAVLVAVVRLML